MCESTSATQIRVGVIDSGWDTRLSDHRVEEGIGLLRENGGLFARAFAGHDDSNGDLDGVSRTSCFSSRRGHRSFPFAFSIGRFETLPNPRGSHRVGLRTRHQVTRPEPLDEAARRHPMLYRACETARRADRSSCAPAAGSPAMLGTPAARTGHRACLLDRSRLDRSRLSAWLRGRMHRTGKIIAPVARWTRSVSTRRASPVPVVTGIIANILSLQPAAPLEIVREALRNPPSDGVPGLRSARKAEYPPRYHGGWRRSSTIQRTSRGQSQWRRS